MVNNVILHNRIKEKIGTQLLHAIVFESFLNGLPIERSEITKTEEKELQRYTYDIVKSIGGINALEAAVDFVNKTPEQNIFLGEIYNVCMESANEKATEVVKTHKKGDKKTLEEMVNSASLSEKEISKFTKKADCLDLNEVSQLIKEKTLAVIKDEQEQYEKEQEIDQELKDAVSPLSEKESSEVSKAEEDIDPDAMAEESFIQKKKDIFLSKTDPRYHVSLFSKMQETAMEMMDLTPVGENGHDIFPIVYKTTFEAFLKPGKKYFLNSIANESLGIAPSSEVCKIDPENRVKYATLTSIITYTAMETLNTMGIYSPSSEEIREMVNRKVNSKTLEAMSNEELYKSATEIVRESLMTDFTKMNTSDLHNRLTDLKKVTEMVDAKIKSGEYRADLVDIASEATVKINQISDILHQKDNEAKRKASAMESFNTRRQKVSDIAQFNRIAGMFGKNPLVSEINLVVDPNVVSSIIDVRCANESQQIVKSSYMNMEYVCEASTYLDYLKETFEKSCMKDCGKKVSIIVNDGNSTKYNLN